MPSNELQGLPETLGRYEIRGLLGRGGMGRVVAGHDPVLRRSVAIKLVEPTNVGGDELEEMRFLFHREARATAALRHPNILEVFDYSGPDADQMYLACELVDGPTLEEVVEERGPTAPPVVAALGYELARALEHAHGEGIVHRDIKPENIFWTRGGRVVLADFGIAKAFDGSDRLGGTFRHGQTNLYGSPAYMAPEQLAEEGVGPHTDLYALGVALHEALTAQDAFGGETVEEILEAVIAGEHAQLGVEAPPELLELIAQMMSVEPKDRPKSAAAVAGVLRGILDELGVTDPRIALADFGDHTLRVTALGEESSEPTEIFAKPTSDKIQVPRKSGAWANVATRGPFIFGMIAVAAGMGLGFQLLLKIGALPDAKEYLPAAGATAEPAKVPKPRTAEGKDVSVLLKFSGRSTVFVDGAEVGTWEGRVRLSLPPGPHELAVRSGEHEVTKQVLVLADTDPVFELFHGN